VQEQENSKVKLVKNRNNNASINTTKHLRADHFCRHRKYYPPFLCV